VRARWSPTAPACGSAFRSAATVRAGQSTAGRFRTRRRAFGRRAQTGDLAHEQCPGEGGYRVVARRIGGVLAGQRQQRGDRLARCDPSITSACAVESAGRLRPPTWELAMASRRGAMSGFRRKNCTRVSADSRSAIASRSSCTACSWLTSAGWVSPDEALALEPGAVRPARLGKAVPRAFHDEARRGCRGGARRAAGEVAPDGSALLDNGVVAIEPGAEGQPGILQRERASQMLLIVDVHAPDQLPLVELPRNIAEQHRRC
jgi:hypothetical protein